jgi:predicted exporter
LIGRSIGRLRRTFSFPARHKAAFLFACGALFLGCALLTLRLATREDISELIPQNAREAAEQYALMRDAPFLHTLSITVGGEGFDPRELASATAERLRQAGLVIAAGDAGPSPAGADPQTLTVCLPALLRPEQIRQFGESLNADTVRNALHKARQHLLGPAGPALRAITALDPLGLRELFFASLVPLRKAGALPAPDGRLIDASGRYCLIVAQASASVTDTGASTAVMDTVRGALAELPAGAESLVVGGYRHSEANAAIIKSDLQRILPVSLALLVLLFLLFLRDRQALALVAPPAAAFCVAGPVTAMLCGSLSGIVAGFGSVLLGISADYGIHTYYALCGARSREEGLAALYPSLPASACTTAFAFAFLLFSDIPAIRQMAVFGLSGIAAALFVAFFVLPLLISARGSASPPLRAGRTRPLPALCFVAAATLFIVPASAGLRFDGDIGNLSYIAPETARDEARAHAVWNTPTDAVIIAAVGDITNDGNGVILGNTTNNAVGAAAGNMANDGFEQALRVNDQVWDLLREASLPASGIGPFLPSRERQEKSAAAWSRLRQERGAQIIGDLEHFAPLFGYTASAFDPFRQLFAGGPAEVTPAGLRAAGMGSLLSLFTSVSREQALVYTLLPGEARPEAALLQKLRESGARVVSGAGFRTATAEAAGKDMLRSCLLTVFAVTAAVLGIFRSVPRCAAVLCPMQAGLIACLLFFLIAGIDVNMFHAAALTLVIALSVDYGIFMLAVQEGRMHKNGRKGILLSALTTLAGFGSLMLARHPALFSLGVAVTGGIAAALAAALWLQPLMFAPAEPHSQSAGKKTEDSTMEEKTADSPTKRRRGVDR